MSKLAAKFGLVAAAHEPYTPPLVFLLLEVRMRGALRFTTDSQRPPHGALPTRLLLLALVIATILPAGGCVRRRLNVRSNPPGALVYVDNQQVGTTPCGVDFTYYGTREIRLVKPGYETLTVNQPIPTPWYQIPPIDFVSENLVPTKIRDNRTVTFNLAPQIVVPTEQLLDRANQLRVDTQQYPVTQAGAVIPVAAPGLAPAVVAPPTVITPAAPGTIALPPAGTPVVPLPPPNTPPELLPPP